MEQKKQLLIKVLTKLQPYWNLAEGILALLKSEYIDEKTIESIIHMINQTIKITKKNQQKSMLEKGLQKIKKIQEIETKEKLSNKELDILLDTI